MEQTTLTLYATDARSGKAAYSENTSLCYLGKGTSAYRTRLTFDFSELPANVVIDSAVLMMTLSSTAVDSRTQAVRFFVGNSGIWNPTSYQTSFNATSTQKTTSNLKCYWDVLPAAPYFSGSTKYFHLYEYGGNSQNIYNGGSTSTSRPSITITYHVNGSIQYGQNGTWARGMLHYGQNGAWVQVMPHLGQSGAWIKGG